MSMTCEVKPRLFDLDIETTAINRIKTLTPRSGIDVAVSFGKDSIVLLHLVMRSGVPYRAYYSRAMEPPDVTQFGRKYYPDVIWLKPEMNMHQLCMQKLWLPTRTGRFCCEVLKETVKGYDSSVVATGVRRSESIKRRGRRMYEQCQRRGVGIMNPIVDWSDDDVWSYIHMHGLPYPSLYDEGFKRIGCVMCPLGGSVRMCRDAERWPKIAAYYLRICEDVWYARKEAGLDKEWEQETGLPSHSCPEEFFSWWTGAVGVYPRPLKRSEMQKFMMFD